MIYFFDILGRLPPSTFFFFFNDTATTEIYTLSLHDALPISSAALWGWCILSSRIIGKKRWPSSGQDRKSTRLNSSHLVISYAVFCLKKKKNLLARIIHVHDSHLDIVEMQSCRALLLQACLRC